MSLFRCENCKNRIVQKSGDGLSIRSQGRITIDASGICHAQCFFCKAHVVLPLELTKAVTEERFVIAAARALETSK